MEKQCDDSTGEHHGSRKKGCLPNTSAASWLITSVESLQDLQWLPVMRNVILILIKSISLLSPQRHWLGLQSGRPSLGSLWRKNIRGPTSHCWSELQPAAPGDPTLVFSKAIPLLYMEDDHTYWFSYRQFWFSLCLLSLKEWKKLLQSHFFSFFC